LPKLSAQHALTKEQCEAIGYVAVESAFLERLVEVLIWGICSLGEAQGKFITDPMRLDKRLDLFGDLAKRKLNNPDRIALLTRIISDLKETNNDRNIIIHGLWFSSDPNEKEPSGKAAIAIKLRPRSEPIRLSGQKIMVTAEKILQLSRELYQFCLKEWPDILSFSDKSQ